MRAVYVGYRDGGSNAIMLDADGLYQTIWFARGAVTRVDCWENNGTTELHFEHLRQGVYDDTYELTIE